MKNGTTHSNKIDILGCLVQSIFDHADIIAITILPIFVISVNSSFLTNRPGDIDTWFYYGHFKTLGLYRHMHALSGLDYYETRLPFTLPGSLIFGIFSDKFAKFLHFYLYSIIICLSLLFVLKQSTSKNTALTATLLMATDIFFIRSAGWNYVDIGVLCYLSLTFLSITLAAKGRGSLSWMAISGFCFTSAVFIHLGSVITVVSVIGYAWYALNLERVGLRRFAALLLAALAGAVICQLLYGMLNVIIWRTQFFFVLRQIAIGRIELSTLPQWRPMSELWEKGTWLVVHIAACAAAIFLLALATVRLIRLTRFQSYCFASVVLQYLLYVVFDYLRMSEFLMRDGLYTTFLIFSTYLTIGAILPRAMPAALTWLVGILFTASLIVRLRFEGGTALSGVGVLPVWSLGILIAVALSSIGWARHRAVTGVGLSAIALLSLLISWRFTRDDTIYTAREIIAHEAGHALPRFLISKNDPLYGPVMASLVGSFTEQAWWLHGEAFPIPPSGAFLDEKLFVVSSTLSDYDAVRNELMREVDSVKPLIFAHIERKGGDFWIHGFEVTNRVSLPAALRELQPRRSAIPGAALPSLVGRVEGEARVAAEETPKGVLTYGPYAELAPGRYDVAISYSATSEGSSWDATVNDGKDPAHVLQRGALGDTGGKERELHVPLTITGFAVQLQVRTFYAGSGTLAVKTVGIRPLNTP